jgi:hypothetical protein
LLSGAAVFACTAFARFVEAERALRATDVAEPAGLTSPNSSASPTPVVALLAAVLRLPFALADLAFEGIFVLADLFFAAMNEPPAK